MHKSIEHFLWNPADFFSDDVLLSVDCFHKLCLSGTPSVNSQSVPLEILGTRWPGVIGLMQNESDPWEVMPEVFKCSL